MRSRNKSSLVERTTSHQVGERIEQFNQTITLERPAVAVFIRGGFVLVDQQDVEILYQRRWNMAPHRKTAYCVYHGRLESLKLHRVLVPDATLVDHINRAGWDNTRCNLRKTDSIGNSHNHGPWAHKTSSRFKGVTYEPKKKLYRARIMVEGKSIGLGRFKSEHDAAKAYDAAAKKYYGEFAYVNFARD